MRKRSFLRKKLPRNIIGERIKMSTANVWERNGRCHEVWKNSCKSFSLMGFIVIYVFLCLVYFRVCNFTVRLKLVDEPWQLIKCALLKCLSVKRVAAADRSILHRLYWLHRGKDSQLCSLVSVSLS